MMVWGSDGVRRGLIVGIPLFEVVVPQGGLGGLAVLDQEFISVANEGVDIPRGECSSPHLDSSAGGLV